MLEETTTPSNSTPVIYSSDDFYNERPELAFEPFDKRPLLIGGVIVLAFFLVTIGFGVWLFLHPDSAETIRDIFIIYVGVGIFVLIPIFIVFIVVATYLILKINDLVQLLNREIKPMLFNIQDSIHNVKGTTTFLSENAVAPVISTVSMVAGVRAVIRSLFKR